MLVRLWNRLIDEIASRQAIRDLRSLDETDRAVNTLDESNPLNRAKVSLDLGDKVSALHYWQEALLHYPGLARDSHKSLDVLLGLELFVDAEKLMLEGRKRHPKDIFYSAGYAAVAQRRGDRAEAVRRWRQVRRQFPGSWRGYVHGAKCLRELGNVKAAEKMFARAIRRFPWAIDGWMEWALTAEWRKDWQEAIRRWRIFSERFSHARGDVGISKAFCELGQLDMAEEHVRDALTRFPLDLELWTEKAHIQALRGAKSEELETWNQVLWRFVRSPVGYEQSIRLHRELGQLDDEERVALEAVKRFSTEMWPHAAYAAAAEHRGAWQEAADRWKGMREKWPDRPEGFLRGAAALDALGRTDDAAALRSVQPL